MHKDFVYTPSFATNISIHTLRYKLEPFEKALSELNDLIYVAKTAEEVTVTVDFLENIEALLEKVVRRKV